MILQLALGGLSGLYVIFRMFKQKIVKTLGMEKAEQPHLRTATVVSPVNDQETGELRRSA
jgi:hypothetical protein